MLEIFGASAVVNDYQKARAIMATLFNAALLANPSHDRCVVFELASIAVSAADCLLEELGYVDPDKVS